jgi:hypothetical protein
VKSNVLFDKVGIALKPVGESEDGEKRLQQLSDHINFFWTLAAESWQYLANHDLAYYRMVLERLQNILGQVREVIDGTPRTYTHTRLYTTQTEQIAALRRLCDEMETLIPGIVKMGGDPPPDPCAIVEKRLELLVEQ